MHLLTTTFKIHLSELHKTEDKRDLNLLSNAMATVTTITLKGIVHPKIKMLSFT